MSTSDKDKEAINVILGQVKDPYITIWFRAYVFDNGCNISAFRQPKTAPKTRRNLDLSTMHERLTEILLEKQRMDDRDLGKPWTCITITVKADGSNSVDLRYENPKTIDIHRLHTEWKDTAMAGLQFIPDKR